jgi:hypothetical protein
MTASQVASAIRRQQRAQRIVANGGGYPTQALRWAARHPKAVGLAAAGLGGLTAAVVFAPLAAAAAVGLGAFGAARHPAFRAAVRGVVRGGRLHVRRGARWLRDQWTMWRRRRTPLDGELIDEPTTTTPPPEPDIVDAEVVEEPKAAIGSPKTSTAPPPASTEGGAEPSHPPTNGPRPDPQDWMAHVRDIQRGYGGDLDFPGYRDHSRGTPVIDPHRPAPAGYGRVDRRQQRALSNRPAQPEPIKENKMRIFDTLSETVAGLPGLELGRGEGGGHDIERWAESLADFFEALGGRVSNDASGIAERYPMDSTSQESMGQLGAAITSFSSQVREQVEEWKARTSWQYTDNNA